MKEWVKTVVLIALLLIGIAFVVYSRIGYQTNFIESFR